MAKSRLNITVEYRVGSVVYHRANVEKVPGIITGYYIGDDERVSAYDVSWGSDESDLHVACELTDEFVPDFAKEE